MFDWKSATESELGKYMATVSGTNVSQQKFYWAARGNTEMVEKIERCKKIAKKWKILLDAEKLGAIIPCDIIVN